MRRWGSSPTQRSSRSAKVTTTTTHLRPSHQRNLSHQFLTLVVFVCGPIILLACVRRRSAGCPRTESEQVRQRSRGAEILSYSSYQTDRPSQAARVSLGHELILVDPMARLVHCRYGQGSSRGTGRRCCCSTGGPRAPRPSPRHGRTWVSAAASPCRRGTSGRYVN
jgi:hypothetical protein